MKCPTHTRVLAAAVLTLAASICSGEGAGVDAAPGHPLDRVVRDVCSKQIVVLGEDSNHGSGETIAIKAVLVRRLVEECGFPLVVFEGSFHEFLALEKRYAAGTATPQHLADAIGGLWSTTAEIDPLVTYLHDAATNQRLRIAGVDLQVAGATQRTTQKNLASWLTSPLAGARRAACHDAFDRLAVWRYDDASPYDASERARLQACVDDATQAIAAGKGAEEARVMLDNMSSYLAMSDGNQFGIRDRRMFENLRWHLARTSPAPRAIVWTATVHAVRRSANGGAAPLGAYLHEALGDGMAAIGFSALAGAYAGLSMPQQDLLPADKESLESKAFGASTDDLAYVDHDTLRGMGRLPGRALDYSESTAEPWSDMLDGLIVLRTERPPHRIRPARPQQKDPATDAVGD